MPHLGADHPPKSGAVDLNGDGPSLLTLFCAMYRNDDGGTGRGAGLPRRPENLWES